IALGQASGPTRSVIESEAGQGSPRARRRGDLFGIHRSDKAVAQAARIGAQVAVSDFFEVRPGARISSALTLPLEFDAIIANPTYIRQELLGEHKSRINRLFGRGMNLKGADAGPSHRRVSSSGSRAALGGRVPDQIYIPEWSGRSDIYVYFFAHAAAFLK